MGSSNGHTPNYLVAVWTVVRGVWAVAVFVIIEAGIFSGAFGMTASVMIIAGAVLARARQLSRPDRSGKRRIEDFSMHQLRDLLAMAENELRISSDEVRRLRQTLTSLDEVDRDDDLRDKVLALVASTLTAYDTSGGKVSAGDAIESLRTMLRILGSSYQEDQTRHFTDADWEEVHRTMSGHARRRKSAP